MENTGSRDMGWCEILYYEQRKTKDEQSCADGKKESDQVVKND